MPTMWGTLAPVAVPAEISRRQFFQVLANKGTITREEALAAVTAGVLPSAIEDIISLISDADIQFAVRMAFAALTFSRSNWCVEMFGAMQGMSSGDIDTIWRDGALID